VAETGCVEIDSSKYLDTFGGAWPAKCAAAAAAVDAIEGPQSMTAQVKYAKNGNVHIAYRIVGEGPLDLVVVPGWVSHLEAHWENPLVWRFAERLAAFSRLILFDKRGTGLSDPSRRIVFLRWKCEWRTFMPCSMPWVRHGRAVGFPRRCDVAVFAATYPERTSALVMSGCYAKWIKADDYPWAPTREEHEAAFVAI